MAKMTGELAKDIKCMKFLDNSNAVRMVWAMLRSPNVKLQIAGGTALLQLIQYTTEGAHMIRNMESALHLTIKLLQSHDTEVLCVICQIVKLIAKDNDNLEILTELGVAVHLTELLITQTDDNLRYFLSDAVAMTANNASNRRVYAYLEAATFIVSFFNSKSIKLKHSACRALYQLSKHPLNCMHIHQHGAMPVLLKMAGSLDAHLHEAAAACLGNLRRLGLVQEIMADGKCEHLMKQEEPKEFSVLPRDLMEWVASKDGLPVELPYVEPEPPEDEEEGEQEDYDEGGEADDEDGTEE